MLHPGAGRGPAPDLASLQRKARRKAGFLLRNAPKSRGLAFNASSSVAPLFRSLRRFAARHPCHRLSLVSRRANRFGFIVGAPSGAMLLDVFSEPVVPGHARQLLHALRSTWMCKCRGRRMRWSDLSTAVPDAVLPPPSLEASTAVPDAVLPPPSLEAYLLHPCGRFKSTQQ
jgi:hypothetical protein